MEDSDQLVAVVANPFLAYPSQPPYNPDEDYPEYVFRGLGAVDRTNKVYAAVRETLARLRCDVERYGTPDWNPLRGAVNPGDNVVVTPNAVLDRNINANESVFAAITHGAVIRAVVDYVFKALNGQGSITLASAPVMVCDFGNWQRICGVMDLVSLYRKNAGFDVAVVDLRQLVVGWDATHNFIPRGTRCFKDRDPKGYKTVDLGSESAFAGFGQGDVDRMVGADYDCEETVAQHSGGQHRYHVAQTVLDADVFVSIPKLKVHQKVGVTLTMKGMVGTQGNKNFIPHFRRGCPSDGGDEYPRLGRVQRALNRAKWIGHRLPLARRRIAEDAYRLLLGSLQTAQRFLDWTGRVRYREYCGNIEGGAWYGNDTAWRMAQDLTRIILCADRTGRVHPSQVRRFFGVVDGIVGGEGDGPLAPRAKSCGVVIAGTNPLWIDAVGARLMGFDPRRIPLVARTLTKSWLNPYGAQLDGVRIVGNLAGCQDILANRTHRYLAFTPHRGWQGHIEVGERNYCPLEARWIENPEA